MKNVYPSFASSLVLSALLLTGCGGGGSSGPATASGTFIDSAVVSLHYTSGGQSGSTGADGSFTCEVGQPVTFTIGNLELPTVTCTAGANVVSPMTLFETADLSDPRVVNLAQLLQTLDSNSDPDDGITIDAGVYTALTDISGVSFDDAGFDADAALGDFLTEAMGTPTSLVSGAHATAHLQSQTLVGSWYLSDAAGHATLTFFADGSYMLAEDGPTAGDGHSGMERGTYTWNQTTDVFTASTSVDTNGDWGLSSLLAGTTVQIAGNALTFTDTEGPFTLARVMPDTNPIVGSWYFVTNNGHHVTFTFFADGSYMQAEDGTTDGDGHSGMERGSHTWNQTTGAFTASTSADTNGEWGASHPQGTVTVQIVGNTLTVTDTVEGTFALARVVP